MTSVLQILSAARVWTLEDSTEHTTGFWAGEFVVPYTGDIGWPARSAPPAPDRSRQGARADARYAVRGLCQRISSKRAKSLSLEHMVALLSAAIAAS